MPARSPWETLRPVAVLYAVYAVACLVLGLIGCHEGWWTK